MSTSTAVGPALASATGPSAPSVPVAKRIPQLPLVVAAPKGEARTRAERLADQKRPTSFLVLNPANLFVASSIDSAMVLNADRVSPEQQMSTPAAKTVTIRTNLDDMARAEGYSGEIPIEILPDGRIRIERIDLMVLVDMWASQRDALVGQIQKVYKLDPAQIAEHPTQAAVRREALEMYALVDALDRIAYQIDHSTDRATLFRLL